MSLFYSKLHIQDNDGFPFTLLRDLKYKSDVLDRTINVRKGFKTDYASIPALVQLLLPKIGKYDRAAVVHDYLYTHNGCTRKQADRVLREAMDVLEVAYWRQFLIYWGVRIGGWWPWDNYRNSDFR